MTGRDVSDVNPPDHAAEPASPDPAPDADHAAPEAQSALPQRFGANVGMNYAALGVTALSATAALVMGVFLAG